LSGLVVGKEIPDSYKLCRRWAKPNPGTLPPCEAWLQANHYGDKGWSFEVILYSEQISRLKAADPNDLLVGVPSSELKFTIDRHRFYPIYTPLADIEHHGDLVCDDPSGVMVTANATIQKVLRKYRKWLLDPVNASKFYWI